MNDERQRQRQDVALFRYALVSEVSRLTSGSETAAKIRELAAQYHRIPHSTRTRISEQTLRDWIRAYQRDGFEALLPKARSDRGQPRHMSAETLEALLALKREQPKLSVRELITRISATMADDEPRLTPSTVNRVLHSEGLMAQVAGLPVDRRRFAHEFAGELWMSDVLHGPKFSDGQRRHRSYLIAFIDDATRVIPYAAFARSENTVSFMSVMKQALLRRGLPQRLYVDNGAAYRSRQLALTCARLDIALIYARPYQPAGKGKIERFFRTLRSSFLSHLETPTDLSTLNRQLWSWVEGKYHVTGHRGIDNMTPLDKWASCADQVRTVPPQMDLDDLFLFEAKRRVSKDRTVQLNCNLYEVDAMLIGQIVTLRFDPKVPASRPLKVVHDGQPAGEARLLDAYANTKVKRHRPTISFSDLKQQHPEQ